MSILYPIPFTVIIISVPNFSLILLKYTVIVWASTSFPVASHIVSNIIFLVTIFIGGFAFHILWEAKSRYIIPYIVILIPLASLCINQSKINECVSEIISKVKSTFNWKVFKEYIYCS